MNVQLKAIFTIFLSIFLIMPMSSIAFAQGTTEPPTASPAPITTPLEEVQSIGSGSGLNNFVTGQHPDAPPDYVQPGAGTISSPIFFAIDMIKYFVSGIAMIFVIVAAIRLVSSDNEDDYGKAKNTIIFSVFGFILIQVADVIVRRVFFGEQGEAFEDIGTTQLFAEEGAAQIRGIVGLINVFLGAVAVLVLVIRGFTVVSSGGDEEALTKAKNQVMYAGAGLVLIGLSEVIIRGFIFPEAGSQLPDVNVGVQIIVRITNFVAGFVAFFSFLTLFYGGYRYVASAGNDEETGRIKKLIFAATAALVLAMGAFAIVNTILQFEAPPDSALSTSPSN